MLRASSRLCVAVLFSLSGVLASTAWAQQTQTHTTEVKRFQVVSVDGNTVVVKEPEGSREITVPDDFRFNVAGRQMSVHELKPGMRGTATITTTTTVKPVYVTEVRNGQVMQVSANSILIRGPNGFRMFTQGDIEKRGVKIYKDGQPVEFSQLHTGDKLTATIITEGAPHVMTQRQVQANITGQPAAAAGPSTAQSSTGTSGLSASSSTTTTTAPSAGTTKPARRLPKTASSMPLVGALGAASLAVGLLMTLARRRRAAL